MSPAVIFAGYYTHQFNPPICYPCYLYFTHYITDEDDLDGIPLVYDDYKRKKRDSSEEDSQSQDNGSEYSEDSRGFDRLQG